MVQIWKVVVRQQVRNNILDLNWAQRKMDQTQPLMVQEVNFEIKIHEAFEMMRK